MEYIFYSIAVLITAFVVLILAVFLKEVKKRYSQCGNLLRSLLESHVTEPLGEYAVVLFGTMPSRLRIFRQDDRAGALTSVTFEIRPRGLFSYDRHEYSIGSQELPELVRLLRRAAGVQGR